MPTANFGKMTDQTFRARLLRPKSDNDDDDENAKFGFSTYSDYKDNCSPDILCSPYWHNHDFMNFCCGEGRH